MENQTAPLDTLREFLNLPLLSSAVFEKFAQLPGAVVNDEPYTGFLYIPSSRPSPVLMVAHADAVVIDSNLPNLSEDDETICHPGHILGADDRAGCAIIYALRHLGHGILITDGEEDGCLGACNLVENHKDLCAELQERYQFIVEFDRKGPSDYKCYDVGTDEFRQYIEQTTHFTEPDRRSCTDIIVLAQKICGVNLSCGYQRPHSDIEYIIKNDWLNTFHLAEQWLSQPDLPKFCRP